MFSSLDRHEKECEATENHKVKLVKLIGHSFAKIRLHHIADRATENACDDYVRKHLAKTILFKHQ